MHRPTNEQITTRFQVYLVYLSTPRHCAGPECPMMPLPMKTTAQMKFATPSTKNYSEAGEAWGV